MISKRQEEQIETTHESNNDLKTSGDRKTMHESNNDRETPGDTGRRRTYPIMISKRKGKQAKTTHESSNDLEASGDTYKDEARTQ